MKNVMFFLFQFRCVIFFVFLQRKKNCLLVGFCFYSELVHRRHRDSTFHSHTQLNWFHHHRHFTTTTSTITIDISIHATVFQIHIKVKYGTEKKTFASNVYVIMSNSSEVFFSYSLSLTLVPLFILLSSRSSRFSIYFKSLKNEIELSLLPR